MVLAAERAEMCCLLGVVVPGLPVPAEPSLTPVLFFSVSVQQGDVLLLSPAEDPVP